MVTPQPSLGMPDEILNPLIRPFMTMTMTIIPTMEIMITAIANPITVMIILVTMMATITPWKKPKKKISF